LELPRETEGAEKAQNTGRMKHDSPLFGLELFHHSSTTVLKPQQTLLTINIKRGGVAGDISTVERISFYNHRTIKKGKKVTLNIRKIPKTNQATSPRPLSSGLYVVKKRIG